MNDIESPSTPLPTSTRTRRALPRWAQILILLTVFASGGAFGASVATKRIHNRMETYRTNAPVFANDITSRLRLRLGLTNEQATAVNKILESRHQRMIEARSDGAKAMHSEFDVTVREVAELLDEQQAKKWRSVSETVRSRFLPSIGESDGSAKLDGTDGEPSGFQFGPKPDAVIFDRFDDDQSGTLTKEEVPGLMWGRLSDADSNDNGEVTRLEFEKYFELSKSNAIKE